MDDINFDNKLRQKGPQEINITEIVKPITKKAVLLKNSNGFKKKINDLIQLSKLARPGPVLIDIPLDLQSKIIKHENVNYNQNNKRKNNNDKIFDLMINRLLKAKKPLIILGHGVKNSKSEDLMKIT